MAEQVIRIRGAREHNLKNIDVDIPKNRLVVITGLSGSGKSSLAFDTLYAEGQRRYVESLSAYARQFLELMEKPDVEFIEGLAPAISIEQKTTSRNPRSTVGTVTEIHDYLRLLYARIGTPHCPQCGKRIESQTVQTMVDRILAWPAGTKFMVLSPVIRDRKGEYRKLFKDALRDGFVRARVNGVVYDLNEAPELDKKLKHSIEIVVDRLVMKDDVKNRLTESVELALEHAHGLAIIHRMDTREDVYLSERLSCMTCEVSLPEMEPRLFSFNSPHGACPKCDGLGVKMTMDPDKVIGDATRPVGEGAVAAWNNETGGWFKSMSEDVIRALGADPKSPWKDLPKKVQHLLLFGSAGKEFDFVYKKGDNRWKFTRAWEGILPNMERRYKESESESVREALGAFMSSHECEGCRGKRLRPEALAVKMAGRDLADLSELPVGEAQAFFTGLKLTAMEQGIARQILKEIRDRLSFLANVGLGYLNLSRSANTLSGGESQRIRLATQVGSQLTGVLYVLDEPSIGLHQRDNARLLDTLKSMRDLGNTVVVVEHDEETIRSADHVLDLGPGAGEHGGRVVAEGTPAEVARSKASITGAYLRGDRAIAAPERRRTPAGHLTLKGCRQHNLKNLTVRFPLGVFTVVCGISGSGKSTLVHGILGRVLHRHFYGSGERPGTHDKVDGLSQVDKVIEIDQTAIGRTPRSNPATYTGLFTPIRDLFASVPEARMRGYKAGRFSFNVKGGRCEACQGDGVLKIEMHFLPDVYVTCDTCHGKRYNRETLEIRYKGKNIADVLDMTVEDGVKFFENVGAIHGKLVTLLDVGLGYIRLGQAATTLSGGEAQRVKLSKELSRRATGRTFYILDEPTTGLHFEDTRQLIAVLQRLVDQGNTVLVIEHNLDVIRCADHLIELGPEGGAAGGHLVAEGAPETVAAAAGSPTGAFLRRMPGFTTAPKRTRKA